MVRRTISSIACVILATGCASATLTVVKRLPGPAKSVTIAIDDTDQMTLSQAGEFRTLVASRVSLAGVSVVSSGSPHVHDVTGDVSKYSPGIRALRYWIGFGAGRGSMDSTWTVRDESDDPVGICRIVGSVAMGVFGANWNDVLEKVGDRLATCLLLEE